MRHATPPSAARAVRLFTHFGIASLASLTFLSLPTLAGPVNPNVVSGAANFQQFGTHHQILVSNGAIINYDSFNISSIESVQFIQPGSTSSVLNRITGGAPTSINGTLIANGTVFFVNPAGIVFGPNAVAHVGGLHAAAGDVSNLQYLDFVKGLTNELVFTNLNGSVINHGNIQAQREVHLLGRHVANHGLINVAAPDGVLMMSAADGQIRLSHVGGHYSVQLDMTGATVPGVGVENTGVLNAANGRIALGAGDLYSLAAIRLEGNGITGRQAEFNGNVRLGSDVTITTESALFAGSLDSEAGGPARSLSIERGGLYAEASATMNGPVGDLLPLASVHADTDLAFNSSARFGGNATAGRDLTFAGPVHLTAPGGAKQSIVAGRELRFNSTIAGSGADLDLAALEVFLGGAVSGVGALDVSGTTRLGANVTTSGGAVFNDAVILTGNSTITDTGTGGVHMLGTIDGPFAFTVVSLNGDASFGGNIGETAPLARFETAVGGSIVFEGNLVRAAGDILLNQNVQTVLVPAFATIGAAGDIHFVSLNGSFAMGQNQKLTAGGNLAITAANSATLGDLSSLGDMIVNANAILILTRSPGPVQNALGVSTMDLGVDFVAGGRFFFSVVPVVLGNGPRPQFASPHLNADANGTLGAFTMRLSDGVSPGDVRRGDGRFLDLRASGIAIADLRTIFTAAIRDEDRGEIEDEVSLSPTDAEALRRLAIHPRLLNDAELADFAAGRGVYIDAPSTRVFEAATSGPRVAVERLSSRRVQAAVAAYDRVRYMAVEDVDTGEIEMVDQAPSVRSMLEAAWNEHFVGAGAAGTHEGFREHLEVTDHPALARLDGMRTLEQEMAALGLTRAEIDQAMLQVLEPFTPWSMTVEELREAIR